VLSTQERRSRNENENEEERARSRGGGGIPALAVAAIGLAIVFVVIGAPIAGVVVLAAPAVAWLLSRYWRDIGAACEAAVLPMDGRVDDD